jgi:hypothetical protein
MSSAIPSVRDGREDAAEGACRFGTYRRRRSMSAQPRTSVSRPSVEVSAAAVLPAT